MPRRRLLPLAIAQLALLPTANGAVITVSSTADGPLADDGVCTLREAIQNANIDSQGGRTMAGECSAGSGSDEIEFDSSVFATPQTLALTLGEMPIMAPLTIIGPGRDRLTVDAGSLSRHFTIDDGDTNSAMLVSMSDITLAGGQVSDQSGGSINTKESLALARVTLSGNTVLGGGTNSTLGRGGALNAYTLNEPGVTIALDDVRLESNQARNGGALSARFLSSSSPNTVSIINSEVIGNRARPSGPVSSGQAGGTINAGAYASVVVRDSTISDNEADGVNRTSVGGLRIETDRGSDVLIERVQVLGNTAGLSSDGEIGGLHVRTGGVGGYGAQPPSSMRLIDSTIAGNTANLKATGGLSFNVQGPGTFVIERSTISGNVAGTRGGAYLSAVGATIQIINSTISGNRADGDAGGIDAYMYYDSGTPGRIEILQSTVVENSADADMDGDGSGGGVFVNSSSYGTLAVDGSILAGNIDNSATPYPDLQPNGQEVVFSNSLLGDNTGTTVTEAPIGNPDADGNLVGDPAGMGIIVHQLGLLTDNGGLTLTHAPAFDSPVIDMSGNCTGTDQRGQSRPVGPACDMGSVEFTDIVFSNGFELAPIVKAFSARGAVLDARSLAPHWLPNDGSYRMVLRAQDSGAAELGIVYVHARARKGVAEVRISRYENGKFHIGRWEPVSLPTTQIDW